MKPIFTRQLYWSGEEAIALVQEAEKIMIRERWSFNKILEEALKEFVRRHKRGNVSFRLDEFGVTWTKAVSVNREICERCNHEAAKRYRCLCISGSILNVCEACKDELKRQTTLKRVLGASP